MKMSKKQKINFPCKPRKYWFDRKHSWKTYHNHRTDMMWSVCKHCMTAVELLGEDNL